MLLVQSLGMIQTDVTRTFSEWFSINNLAALLENSYKPLEANWRLLNKDPNIF